MGSRIPYTIIVSGTLHMGVGDVMVQYRRHVFLPVLRGPSSGGFGCRGTSVQISGASSGLPSSR